MRRVAVMAVCIVAGAFAPPVIRAPFVDEAPQEPSLVDARQRVINALMAQDNTALLKAMHPLIRFDVLNGPENSPFDFDPRSRGDVNRLLRILQMGGAFKTYRESRFSSRQFCAPFAFAKYPPIDALLNLKIADGTEFVPPAVVFGAQVPVYGRPTKTARVVARLSYELVRPTLYGPELNDGWRRIDTEAKSGLGWIERSELWIPGEDPAVCFGQFGSEWLLTRYVTLYGLND